MTTTSWLTSLLGTLAASVLLAPSTSCVTLECAEGTIEQDGECRPADTDPDNTECGPGTELSAGTCVPSDPTVCGVNTTAQVDPVTGVTTCVGTGDTQGCTVSLQCPAASSGKVTVCGRFVNVEDDANIEAPAATGMQCGEGGVEEGPCGFDLDFYDALDFAGNPSGAVPLAVEELIVDDCGRFIGRNITRPQLGFLGIGVDDGAGGDYQLSGVAFPVVSAEVRDDQRTYVLATSTNTAWSGSNGANITPTFVERGVFVSLFLYDGDPVAGVTVEDTNGARPNDDFYFADTDPLTRSDVDPSLTDTGVNGMALFLNSSLVEHTGSGSEPAGCQWPSDLAASIPGVMFFNPRHAETPAGNDCP